MKLPNSQGPSGASRFYAWTWRWHFYAGLFVIPFISVLAATGLVMILYTGFQSNLGPVMQVTPQGQAKPLAMQAEAAQQAVPGGMLMDYIAPPHPQQAGWFMMEHDEQTHAVAVDPYTGSVLKTMDPGKTLYFWARRIHNDLLLGNRGGRLIEVAAGFGIVMVVTGLYLFWPRNGQAWRAVLFPLWAASGRRWWKSLHAATGFWISLALLAFLLTGMAWTGFWGGRLVQPMSTYPAARMDKMPTSDRTHAALNGKGQREVPWGLEQAPLPLSGSMAGTPGVVDGPVTLDSVNQLAQTLGFQGQYHIKQPHDANGVYTIMADTMAGDVSNPMDERTVHVDRYTGKVLADIGFSDYSVAAKTMSTGIALHQGNMGWFSLCLNILLCVSILFLCTSGLVMWWMRRPSGTLGVPPAPAPLWKGGAVLMVLAGVLFPLTGLAMLGALAFDFLVISRVGFLKRRFA